MNQSRSFVRKVIYIATIGGMLIPLSLVSRPATRDKLGSIKDPGGVLSAMRDKYELSQARLSEIDAGSETMKLASLGLRGVAVNILWMKAIDAMDKKDWDTFSSTLNSLAKIQPNFVKVWEYQGHNLSYNVSVEFDDYEQRYTWVKKGIKFLTRGIPYNRRDHRIIDSLGFFCGNKIGTADEKTQFRSLFRNDDAFLEEMGKFVNVDRVNATPYGPDHWLLAYEWYDRSVEMVEKGVDGMLVERKRKEELFYQFKPAQLRNMGLALHSEFRSDEFARMNWKRAYDEWMEYGNRPLVAVDQVEVTLDSLTESLANVQRLRNRLDAIVPGARQHFIGQRLASLTEEERALVGMRVDELNDEQLEIVRRIDMVLYGGDSAIDIEIARNQAPPERRDEAIEILKPLLEENFKITMGDHFRGTSNYDHWKNHTLVESSDDGIAARQSEFDAMELRGQSIFDEYDQRNFVTGSKKTMPGSIQKFDEAFAVWSRVMEEKPSLRIGPLFDDIVDMIDRYRVVRVAAGNDSWPDDFVLQDAIDYRSGFSNAGDNLPTSPEVAERNEARGRAGRYRLGKRPDIEFKLGN